MKSYFKKESFAALKGGFVPKDGKEQAGIKTLLCHYKSVFRTPENLNHYTQSDFRAAEKKFLKYVLLGHDSRKEEKRFM